MLQPLPLLKVATNEGRQRIETGTYSTPRIFVVQLKGAHYT
jgi:hypothetical protein